MGAVSGHVRIRQQESGCILLRETLQLYFYVPITSDENSTKYVLVSNETEMYTLGKQIYSNTFYRTFEPLLQLHWQGLYLCGKIETISSPICLLLKLMSVLRLRDFFVSCVALLPVACIIQKTRQNYASLFISPQRSI